MTKNRTFKVRCTSLNLIFFKKIFFNNNLTTMNLKISGDEKFNNVLLDVYL